MAVDMSPQAVMKRLVRVGELNRLCRALAQAGRQPGLAQAAGDHPPDQAAPQSPKEIPCPLSWPSSDGQT